MPIEEAITQCEFSPKGASAIVKEVCLLLNLMGFLGTTASRIIVAHWVHPLLRTSFSNLRCGITAWHLYAGTEVF